LGAKAVLKITVDDIFSFHVFQEGTYDPWGKGYGGLPERKENGKIMRNRQHLNDKFKVNENRYLVVL
jgi:hypothetical protein